MKTESTKREMGTSLKFSTTAARLLQDLSVYYGLSKTSALEMLLREKARSVGIIVPAQTEEKAVADETTAE